MVHISQCHSSLSPSTASALFSALKSQAGVQINNAAKNTFWQQLGVVASGTAGVVGIQHPGSTDRCVCVLRKNESKCCRDKGPPASWAHCGPTDKEVASPSPGLVFSGRRGLTSSIPAPAGVSHWPHSMAMSGKDNLHCGSYLKPFPLWGALSKLDHAAASREGC